MSNALLPDTSSDLEIRAASRKQVLIAEIREHKMNSSRAGAAEAIDKIKAHLSELAYIVKGGVSPGATLRLEEWVAR